MNASDIRSLLGGYKLNATTELTLQDAIARVLEANDVSFFRESSLTRSDRPDFMIGSLAVEVKIAGSPAEVTRQLHRYAQSEKVTQILLVTTKFRHVAIPASLNRKDVAVHYIGGIQ